MSEHTPGPWIVRDRRRAPLPNIQILSGATEIARVSHVHMRDDLSPRKWTHEEADSLDSIGLANALLIAAAPELLEAAIKAAAFIKEIMAFYGDGLDVLGWHLNGDAEPWDNFFDCCMNGSEEALQAAIAKAEGRL